MAHHSVGREPEVSATGADSRWWRRDTELRPSAPALQRVILGARNATLYFAWSYPLLLLLWLLGGRHAVVKGTPTDTLVLLVAYPLGVAVMGGITGLLVPVMRNIGIALLSGMVAIAPFMFGLALRSTTDCTPGAPSTPSSARS